uniref:Uncharacterized protein n=1 Tax=Haptolina ericina TaxID=156174 RepID=A0A7S3BLJ3_9EUKA
MVDRGADLQWLSMYPFESEVTFAPLSGLEVQSTRVEGSVLVVELRLSVNHFERPIEQIVGQRQTLLGEMAREMELEVRASAVNTAGGFVNTGVEVFKRLLREGPLREQPSYYNTDENFAAAVQEVLLLKRSQVEAMRKLSVHEKRVDLRGWDLKSGANLEMLARWLQAESAARFLDLRNSSLQSDGAAVLAEALLGNPRLESVVVSREELRVQELAGTASSTATTLCLSRRWLGPIDGVLISKLIAHNNSLIELNLSNNVLGQRRNIAVLALCDTLRESPCSLQRLNLAKNYISVEGVMALGDALAHNSTLTVLNLSGNEIDGASAVSLCESAHLNPTLTNLNLSHNDIDEAAVTRITEAVSRSHLMTGLDLSCQHKSRSSYLRDR